MITIDIGNTTIGLALVKGLKIIAVERIDTSDNPRVLKPVLLKAIKKLSLKAKPKAVVICSVVPSATVLVERYIKEAAGLMVRVIGRDILVPMPNKYKNPKQVGQDRLVGAYAAMRLYGEPLIVIDLGTAITFDVVSSKGEYLGGIIVPGLRLSAESLFTKTALLPEIDIKAPKSIIGKTTQESILSGLFYGYGALCQGVIEMISKQLSFPKSSVGNPGKEKIKVVMTGGHTQLMKKFVAPKIRIIDEDLVFKGIYFLSCL